MTRIVSILLFLSTALGCVAENKQVEIDSLLMVLSKAQDTARVNTMNELSKQYVLMDIYDSALSFASSAKTLGEEIKYDKGVALALNRFGVIYSEQGNYPKSLEYYYKALALAVAEKDVPAKFTALIGIGTIYYYQGDYDASLKYYAQTEKINLNKGLTFFNIGRVYMGKENYDLALSYFQEAQDYYRTIKDENAVSTATQNIGWVYESKGDYINALVYYSEALKMKKGMKDEQGQCDILASIGDVCFAQKHYQSAIIYENESLEIAKKINYLSSEVQTEKMLSDIYETMNQVNESYAHYKQYIMLRDSLYNEESTKRIVRAEMNYDFDRKQAEQKAIQDKKDAVNKIVIWSTSIGLFLIVLFSVFLFREYRAKQRANIMITEQKRLVEEKQQEVLASIRYAKRIQQTLLPSEKYIDKTLKRLMDAKRS